MRSPEPLVDCGPACPSPALVVVVMFDCIVERCPSCAAALCDPLGVVRADV